MLADQDSGFQIIDTRVAEDYGEMSLPGAFAGFSLVSSFEVQSEPMIPDQGQRVSSSAQRFTLTGSIQ